jgi:predicted phosphodiesterase
MRLAFTSDLHVDLTPTNAALLAPLARSAAELRPDVLVIAGDVAETSAGVAAALEAFREVRALRIYVPGNHDLYVEGGESSRDKLDIILPRVAARAGFECPHVDPVHFKKTGILGTPGWWDYSLRDPELDAVVSLAHYRAGQWRTQRAFDRGHVLWPRPSAVGDWASDEEICDVLLDRLEAQMRLRSGAMRLLGVVHVLPELEIVPRHAFGPSSFHDAYLGSARFGALLRQDRRLRGIVTGHLHRPLDAHVDAVRVVSSPVGRISSPPADLVALARAKIGCVELA